jgi:hypothetical protein
MVKGERRARRPSPLNMKTRLVLMSRKVRGQERALPSLGDSPQAANRYRFGTLLIDICPNLTGRHITYNPMKIKPA